MKPGGVPINQAPWIVANRYHFPESEIMNMKLRRLSYWVEGHKVIYDAETKDFGK